MERDSVNEKGELTIPKKFEQSCLKKKLTWLENKWIWFIVTENYFLIECYNQVINNCVSLKLFDDNHTLIKKGKSHKVELSVVHTSLGAICIVTIDKQLFMLKRFECHFELIRRDENVVNFRLFGKVNNSVEEENLAILITYKSGKFKKINYSDFCEQEEVDIAKKKEIQKYLHTEKRSLLISIKKVQNERMSKYHKLLENRKFVSKFARFNSDPDEIQPLCRFGSIFKRTCNEKLVIGIPVLNQAQG